MKIRKYVAKNMPEALSQVHEELGGQAVILNSRQLEQQDRFDRSSSPQVEVTVAYEDDPAPVGRPSEGRGTSQLLARRYGASTSQLVEPPKVEAAPAPDKAPPPPPPPPTGPSSGELARISAELRQLRQAVERVERNALGEVPEELTLLGERLRSMEVSPRLVQGWIRQTLHQLDSDALSDRQVVASHLAGVIAAATPPRQDLKLGRDRRVVGFIGASGAGKTTAMAKIAAGFAMRRQGEDRKQIVMVCADDRRVGALDQAKALARLIEVPLEVAYEPDEIEAALGRHQAARLVLVDLAGCGPHEHRQWERQRCLLDAAGASQVQVVLDGMSSCAHMLDMVEASEIFDQRCLLFSKMDEVVRPGAVLSAAVESGLPTSYFVVGPSLPGGIEAGSTAHLAQRLVGQGVEEGKGKGKGKDSDG